MILDSKAEFSNRWLRGPTAVRRTRNRRAHRCRLCALCDAVYGLARVVVHRECVCEAHSARGRAETSNVWRERRAQRRGLTKTSRKRRRHCPRGRCRRATRPSVMAANERKRRDTIFFAGRNCRVSFSARNGGITYENPWETLSCGVCCSTKPFCRPSGQHHRSRSRQDLPACRKGEVEERVPEPRDEKPV